MAVHPAATALKEARHHSVPLRLPLVAAAAAEAQVPQEKRVAAAVLVAARQQMPHRVRVEPAPVGRVTTVEQTTLWVKPKQAAAAALVQSALVARHQATADRARPCLGQPMQAVAVVADTTAERRVLLGLVAPVVAVAEEIHQGRLPQERSILAVVVAVLALHSPLVARLALAARASSLSDTRSRDGHGLLCTD